MWEDRGVVAITVGRARWEDIKSRCGGSRSGKGELGCRGVAGVTPLGNGLESKESNLSLLGFAVNREAVLLEGPTVGVEGVVVIAVVAVVVVVVVVEGVAIG